MKEPTDEQLVKSAKMVGFVSMIIGVLFVFLANTTTREVSLIVGALGVGLLVLGLFIVGKGAEMGRGFIEHQKGKLVEDRKGIIWVWIVVLVTWAIMAVAYFSLSMVVYLVLDQVESYYFLPEESLQTITLTKNVVGWFLIIMTVGLIGWGLINSARRETATYPI